jgi:hypothetical protein
VRYSPALIIHQFYRSSLGATFSYRKISQTQLTMSTLPNQPPSPVVDGVHRLSPTGISIVVVGGGIGGLMFALEAWRQGHDIKVFEKSTRLDTLGEPHSNRLKSVLLIPGPIGDAFSIMAPAWTTLRYFPTMKAQFERESYDAEFSLWHYEGYKLVHHGDGPVSHI